MYHVQCSMHVRDAYLRGSLLALTPLLPSMRRLQKVDSDTRSRSLLPLLLLRRGQLPVVYAGCGKTHSSEGYGLQPVRKCFAMNPALAAEGLPSAPNIDFFRKLNRSVARFSAIGLLVLGLAVASSPPCIAQAAAGQPNAVPLTPPDSRQGLLLDWAGLQVVSITFEAAAGSACPAVRCSP
jgi:hypothetical protein